MSHSAWRRMTMAKVYAQLRLLVIVILSALTFACSKSDEPAPKTIPKSLKPNPEKGRKIESAEQAKLASMIQGLNLENNPSKALNEVFDDKNGPASYVFKQEASRESEDFYNMLIAPDKRCTVKTPKEKVKTTGKPDKAGSTRSTEKTASIEGKKCPVVAHSETSSYSHLKTFDKKTYEMNMSVSGSGSLSYKFQTDDFPELQPRRSDVLLDYYALVTVDKKAAKGYINLDADLDATANLPQARKDLKMKGSIALEILSVHEGYIAKPTTKAADKRIEFVMDGEISYNERSFRLTIYEVKKTNASGVMEKVEQSFWLNGWPVSKVEMAALVPWVNLDNVYSESE